MKDAMLLASGLIMAVYGSTEEFVDTLREMITSLF